MEGEKNRVGYCTLVIAASGWIIVGAAITYLEIRRNGEINPLGYTVEYLRKEVELLQEELRHLRNSTNSRLEQLEKQADSAGTHPADQEEYYEDGFDDDYDDDATDEDGAGGAGGTDGAAGGPRSKRSSIKALKRGIRRPGQALRDRRSVLPSSPLIGNSSPNAILRQSWAKQKNHSTIEAEIILNTQYAQEQRPTEIWNIKPEEGTCCKPIVAHFEGDLPISSPVKSVRYQGNHHLYQNGVISEWEPAKWMNDLDQTTKFNLDGGRTEVAIKEESQGVYYVYAQVFYADPHDTAGFGIFVNHENVFQCTVTSLHQAQTHHLRAKSNSCYTGGLVKLSAGDKVTLREIEGTRSTVMHAPKSFIGMFRVHSS